MRNVWVLAKKELASYFNAPVAYIVIVAFLLVSGFMYWSSVFLMNRADMRTFFAPSPFSPSMLLVILAPAVTMRLIAEEKKSGTIELLSTMPIKRSDIVLGKFLSALLLVLVALGTTLVYAISVTMMGELDWGPVVSGYVGMILFSAAMLAVGLFASTLTNNQIVAFIVGFILCAALYFVYWLQFFMPAAIDDIVEFISLSYHLDNMARGVIDSRNVLYLVSLTAGALFLAVRSLDQKQA